MNTLSSFKFGGVESLIFGDPNVSKLCKSLVSCASPVFLDTETIKIPFRRRLKDALKTQVVVTDSFNGRIETDANKHYLLNDGVSQVLLPPPIVDLDVISITDYSNSWSIDNKLYVFGSLMGKAGTCLSVAGSTVHFVAKNNTWKVLDWGFREITDPSVELKYKTVQYVNGYTNNPYYFQVEGRGYLNYKDITTQFLGEVSQVKVYPLSSDIIWTTLKDNPIGGPITSTEIEETPSPPFDSAFDEIVVLNPRINSIFIELDRENLRYKYEKALIYSLPSSSALLREMSIKAINTFTDLRDPLEIDTEVLEVLQVKSVTSPQESYTPELDYLISDEKLIPTLDGRIDDGEVLSILYR